MGGGMGGGEEGAAAGAAAGEAFRALGVAPALAEACAGLGWARPTPVQTQCVPVALAGRDVIGLAQTGSGKTGAFALPILEDLLKAPRACSALVLSPTRELSLQIAEQFEALGAGIGLRVAVLVGGVDIMAQAIALGRRPHVVVGTPGRVVDHLENTKGFSLRDLKNLVLDEADRLLNMDFEQELDQILKACPRERRTQLFSATMTGKVQKLQRASLRDPVKVEVDVKNTTVDTLRQQYLFIPAKHKECYLAFAVSELSGSTFIIFTRTCDAARRVALILRNLGFGAVPIHGKMAQPKRLGALNRFKAGERAILVATDVASRGLDIPAVDVVVNFDVPLNSKEYVHRVGRTARAGRSGRSLTFVTQYDVEIFQRIEKLTGKKMEAFAAEEEAALLLLDRVGEAQRLATMQMKEADQKRKFRRGRGGDDAGAEEAGEAEAKAELGMRFLKKRRKGGGRGRV